MTKVLREKQSPHFPVLVDQNLKEKQSLQSSIFVEKLVASSNPQYSYWNQKKHEMYYEDFNELWVISRLFVYND